MTYINKNIELFMHLNITRFMLAETAFSVTSAVFFSISLAIAKPYLAIDLGDKRNAAAGFASTQCNDFSN